MTEIDLFLSVVPQTEKYHTSGISQLLVNAWEPYNTSHTYLNLTATVQPSEVIYVAPSLSRHSAPDSRCSENGLDTSSLGTSMIQNT